MPEMALETDSSAIRAASAAPSAGPRPVGEAQRIAALDVLRGVALLGILTMNIRSFAGPFSSYVNPLVMYDYSGASRAAFWATALLFDLKMISIFSMLFGAGALIYSKKESAGRSTARLWFWRMLLLLGIGLIHAYLIWEGDILVIYALCGLIFLWWTRKLPAWALVGLGAAMFTLGGAFSLLTALGFDELPAEDRAFQASFWTPNAEQIAAELAVFRDGYLGIVKHRAPFALAVQTFFFLTFFLWRAGGMMVLGQGLMKLGVLTGARTRRFYATMAVAGYAIGLPLVALGQRQLELTQFAIPQRYILDLYNFFGSVAVALGHVGLVLWLFRARPEAGAFGPLAAVGRMALTNYLMQSLICTTLFYGYGFNLFGRLDYAWQLAVVAAVWALQLALSPWWLRRFHFGPAEWLWRWMTYRARPPMKR